MALIEKYFLQDVNKPNESVTPNDPPPAGGGIVPREKYTQEAIDFQQVAQNNIEKLKDPFFNVTPGADRQEIIDTTSITKQVSNDESANEIIINILAQIPGGDGRATILNNGIPLEGTTPKRYSIKKTDLFERGPQTLELRKFGYISDEKYIFKVDTKSDNPLKVDQVQILQDDKNPENIIGLDKLIVTIEKVVGDSRSEFVLENGNFTSLSFNLLKVRDTSTDISLPEENTNVEVSTMVVSMEGPDASVIVSSNGESDFLNRGTEEFKDRYGTKYFIKTSSPKLYRIAEITVIDSTGKSEVLKAGASESLSTEIVLSGDVKVSILSRRLVKVEKRKPEIRLKSVGTQTYNINDKTDIPIIIEKNDAVRAISLIIGEEILEFDDIKQGRYMGIEIPHNLVEKIGQYQIKLFPYAISELAKGKPEKDVPKYDDLPKVTPDEVPADENLFTPRPVETDSGPRIPDVSPRPIDTNGKSRTPDVSPRPFVPDSGPRTSGTRGVGDNVSRRPQGGGRPFIPDLGPKTPKVIASPPSNRILPSKDGRVRGK